LHSRVLIQAFLLLATSDKFYFSGLQFSVKLGKAFAMLLISSGTSEMAVTPENL
jgi:hypothetical protein